LPATPAAPKAVTYAAVLIVLVSVAFYVFTATVCFGSPCDTRFLSPAIAFPLVALAAAWAMRMGNRFAALAVGLTLAGLAALWLALLAGAIAEFGDWAKAAFWVVPIAAAGSAAAGLARERAWFAR
jgi:hypothetical protein